MQPHPEDAEAHLVSMVSSEIEGVLEDARAGSYANIDAISAWLQRFGPSEDYRERFGLSAAVSHADAIELLSTGVKGNQGVLKKFPILGAQAHKAPRQWFADDTAASTRSNEEFAMLLSLRSHYGMPLPVLTLGTVLAIDEGDAVGYWLCVQPACDCVRLSAGTAFPLLPLRAAPVGERFHLVVQSSTQRIRLALNSKPSQLRMEVFDATDTGRGVVESSAVENLRVFRAASGRMYRWLADLKPQHALWMGNELVAQLSRVGLVESEWLRRWHPS